MNKDEDVKPNMTVMSIFSKAYTSTDTKFNHKSTTRTKKFISQSGIDII